MNLTSIRGSGRLAVLALGLGLSLGACQQQQQQQVMVDPTTLPPPGNLSPGGPPGAAGGQMGNVAPGFDGQYAGPMYLVSGGGGACRSEINVTGMTVTNNHVRFGQFGPGGIGPTGAVQMADGPTWISGQFNGRQFIGQVVQPPPGCTYRMELNRL
jgi:hypothetical protein